MAGRKVFVGSLPDGCQESQIRAQFEKFGRIEDVFVKAGAEPGRQWAFVTYATPEQANAAKEATDRILVMPGADRAVECMLAKNQGKFGQSTSDTSPALSQHAGVPSAAPKKIFVGSLPDSITEGQLRDEFCKYGTVVDIFLKTGCDSGKQWGFITYATSEEAEDAKTSTDRTLTFPGSDKPAEVMLARNQGMNGQDPLRSASATPTLAQGPVKIFVGSLPDSINETVLRAEFSRYGQIVDVYLKTGCETNKNWSFITFATHQQAQHAKDATDRVLVVPGGSCPCETMFAKNQGKNGQDPMSGRSAAGQLAPLASPMPMPMANGGWMSYFTSAGLPYYYNHMTGVTQWECPMELQYAAMQAQAHAVHAAHPAYAGYANPYGAMYGAPAVAAYRPY